MKTNMRAILLVVWMLAGSAGAVTPLPVNQLPSAMQINPVVQLLHQETTLFDGTVWYFPVLTNYPSLLGVRLNVFWWGRIGGQIIADEKYLFPNLWVTNTNITHLMADIGVPTTATLSSSAMWDRANRIWWWMSGHTSTTGSTYSTGIGYPSIADMAWYYQQNGYIERGACMTTAQLMATLMVRAGIPVDRVALAHAHYSATASHVYVLLLLPEGWYYLDPSDCVAMNQLPAYADRTSFGLHTCDYIHPFEINPLPGSGLNSVPLCLDAD